jgi:hypothetical protein
VIRVYVGSHLVESIFLLSDLARLSLSEILLCKHVSYNHVGFIVL